MLIPYAVILLTIIMHEYVSILRDKGRPTYIKDLFDDPSYLIHYRKPQQHTLEWYLLYIQTSYQNCNW